MCAALAARRPQEAHVCVHIRAPHAHRSRPPHPSSTQGALSKLMIAFTSRFLVPTTLTPDSPAFTRLAQQMLHLAKPDTLGYAAACVRQSICTCSEA